LDAVLLRVSGKLASTVEPGRRSESVAVFNAAAESQPVVLESSRPSIAPGWTLTAEK